MKFFIETIGCQQNEYDASRLVIFLKSAGFVEATVKEAEIIFILACSVRQTAVDRIFGRIRNWQKENKEIYITACITDDDKKKLAEKGVIYFSNFEALKTLLVLPKTNNVRKISGDTGYVPIMSGCDNFCSYCIVPYLRGREKSRPAGEIITEVKKLIQSGKKEIVLLGQNVNSYKFGFAKLLKILNDLPGKFQIGFLTNHPKDMTPNIIEIVTTLPKIKKEIHLPLQSGSNKILKLMNRPYIAEEYLRLVRSLKLKVKNLKLSTDIIVGFPGETEEDFQETMKVCKKVKFDLAYINKYSPRKGTAAFKLGDPISWKEKQRRWRVLNELINS